VVEVPDRDGFVLAIRMNVRHEPVWYYRLKGQIDTVESQANIDMLGVWPELNQSSERPTRLSVVFSNIRLAVVHVPLFTYVVLRVW
jgi:hypothetical protein